MFFVVFFVCLFFCRLLLGFFCVFFKINFFEKNLSVIPSEWQTVWIQISPVGPDLGLNCLQTTQAGKELIKCSIYSEKNCEELVKVYAYSLSVLEPE